MAKIELEVNVRVTTRNIIAAKEKKIKKMKKKEKKNQKKSNLVKKIKSGMHEVLYKITGILEQSVKI